MSYQIALSRTAEKDLARLSQDAYEAVVERLRAMKENPRPHGVRKLQGREGYRSRVGDYRILYVVVDAAQIVTVLAIGHRRDVYR